MFASIWNYFTGYVIVEVSGYALERFINFALHNHIYFWDVSRCENKLYFKTSIRHFKELKEFARKTKCRMKIVEKCGFPFTAFRYRKRKLLVGGIMLFISILYILSSFVWLVEVQGNTRLQETDLVATLEQNGFTTGKMKNSLNLREAEQCLINAYSDIIWAGIKFEGTKLVVQVTEAVPKPIMYDPSVPTNLLAKRDALITYIATDKGIPRVKKGDTVKRGDVLVSGEIILLDEKSTVRYTHSDSKIIGKTCYTLKATTPFKQIKKEYTNKVLKNYRIRLFNLMLPIYVSKPEYAHYETVVTLNQFKLTNLFPLPFFFEKTEYVEFVPYERQIIVEESKDQLKGQLYDQLTGKIGAEGKVLYYEINFEQDSETLSAVLNAMVEEPIAEEIPIATSPILPIQNKSEGANP